MTTTSETTLRPERLYAGFLVAQAACGVALWILFATSTTVRSWFELMPQYHRVMDAFVFADILVVVVGSLASAYAIDRRATWAVPVVAFTAGGVVYPTLYLLGWVSFAGTGAACLGIMVPTAVLTCWVTYQTWKLSRRW